MDGLGNDMGYTKKKSSSKGGIEGFWSWWQQFNQKFARPFGSINRVYLMLRSLKETPPVDIGSLSPRYFLLQDVPKIKAVQVELFFCFNFPGFWFRRNRDLHRWLQWLRSWIPPGSRCIIQGGDPQKKRNPKVEFQSMIFRVFGTTTHHWRVFGENGFEKLRSWRHGMPPNLLDFWSCHKNPDPSYGNTRPS